MSSSDEGNGKKFAFTIHHWRKLMLTIYVVGHGKNEGIRLHVGIPNTFSISLLSFFMMQFALGKTTFLN
jgi:hypothetical protein